MFLYDRWYQAAWAAQITDIPFRRILLKEPIVFFRKTNGDVVALEDRCSHRNVPLSMGSVIDDKIRCCYHGLVFDSSGRCIKVPGQKTAPANADIKNYPVAERHGCIWIWMGENNLADKTLLPDFGWYVDDNWEVLSDYALVDCNYKFINDNLLDLSHLAYLHASTVGSADMAENCDVKVEEFEDTVRVTRWTLDTPPQTTYLEIGNFRENIDRWQIIEFTPPSTHIVKTGAAVTGTGAPEGQSGRDRWDITVCHAITPETEDSSHYFWGLADKIRDKPMSRALREHFNHQVYQVIEEDIEILTAQKNNLASFNTPGTVNIKYDAGAIKARRMLDRLLKEKASFGDGPGVHHT